MNEEIKVGDAVTLQHGGQEMTVGHIKNGMCYLDWHDRDGHNQVMGVDPVCLKKISTGDRLEQLLGELRELSSGDIRYSQSPREETTTLMMGGGVRVTIVRPLK